ncbi:MAG: hypothetical protein AAF360_17135, partial [Pseudomonadota bacterium]
MLPTLLIVGPLAFGQLGPEAAALGKTAALVSTAIALLALAAIGRVHPTTASPRTANSITIQGAVAGLVASFAAAQAEPA